MYLNRMNEEDRLLLSVIKLARRNPGGIRRHLMPLIKKAAQGEWTLYDITFTGAMANADAHKQERALGRMFPTGWTWLKDGTLATEYTAPYKARGVVAVPTGKTLPEEEVIKLHVRSRRANRYL